MVNVGDLVIEPRKRFRHGGDLPRFSDNYDPRLKPFLPLGVCLDLRPSEFIQPAAVLWCLVYLLLARARDVKCQLWVPNNMGVCTYLKSLGMFHILQNNEVEVDDRGIPSKQDSQVILSLTRFDTESEVETLTNNAIEALQKSRLGVSNPVIRGFL